MITLNTCKLWPCGYRIMLPANSNWLDWTRNTARLIDQRGSYVPYLVVARLLSMSVIFCLLPASNMCCDFKPQQRFSYSLYITYFMHPIEQQMWELWIQCVWVKKIPPEVLWQFFQNCWEFFDHIFICLLCIPINARIRIFIQLSATFTKLCHISSVTTQFTSSVQNVHHRLKRTLTFSDILPKQLGIFSPNFIRLLSVHIYARIQIFVQLGLSPTLTKLCHIKYDHPACVSVDGGHFEHIMVVALNMA